MSEIGERVIDALHDQGFVTFPTEAGIEVLDPTGARVHLAPTAWFYGEGAANLRGLRLLSAGLEIVEGFQPPNGLW